MSISRRTFIEAAASAAGLVVHGTQAVQSSEPAPRDGLQAHVKTPEGLKPIEWKDIQPGMQLVSFFRENGHIVEVVEYTARSRPQLDVDGCPIRAWHMRTIVCQT